MNNTDIHIGFIYLINNEMQRVSRIECTEEGLLVNGYPMDKVKPLILNDKLFDDFKFKYYNGWYCPFDEGNDTVLFLKIHSGYAVTIGSHELTGNTVRYFHQMQAIIYGLKGQIV
jgi:hypothetical protein